LTPASIGRSARAWPASRRGSKPVVSTKAGGRSVGSAASNRCKRGRDRLPQIRGRIAAPFPRSSPDIAPASVRPSDPAVNNLLVQRELPPRHLSPAPASAVAGFLRCRACLVSYDGLQGGRWMVRRTSGPPAVLPSGGGSKPPSVRPESRHDPPGRQTKRQNREGHAERNRQHLDIGGRQERPRHPRFARRVTSKEAGVVNLR